VCVYILCSRVLKCGGLLAFVTTRNGRRRFREREGSASNASQKQKNRKSQLPTKKKSAQKKRDFVREFTFLRARAHAGRIDIFYVHIQRLGK